MKKKIFIYFIPLSIFIIIVLTYYKVFNINLKEKNYKNTNDGIVASDYLKSKANSIEVENYSDGNEGEMYTFQHASTGQTEELIDYRYIGSKPNNYLYFNCSNDTDINSCELWQIVGVFTVENENGEKEERIKIIKSNGFVYNNNDSLKWDENGSNDWNTASLNDLLNGEDSFYENLSSSSKNSIGKTKWYLGGYTSSITTDNMYSYERGTTVYENHATNWTGNIALLYPSDYAYSFSKGVDNVCYNDLSRCASWSSGDPNSSWIPTNMWFLTPSSTDSRVYSSAEAFYDFKSTSSIHVFPTLYLKHDIYIEDGDGSYESPYMLQSFDETLEEVLSSNDESANNYLISKNEMETFKYDDNNNDYRYIGKNPNNYIYFNCEDDFDTSTCERWRIVGVFNVEDKNGNIKKRMKIVDTVNYFTPVWDNRGGNDWNSSTLKYYLNLKDDYYGTLTDSAISLISSVKWNLGQVSYLDTDEVSADTLYSAERNGPTWTGKIAILYPSDIYYTYFNSVKKCVNKPFYCDRDDDADPTYSWLYSSFSNHRETWLLNGSGNNIFYRGTDGSLYQGSTTDYKYIMPTMYLTTDMSIVAGDGSYFSPYQILKNSYFEEEEEKINEKATEYLKEKSNGVEVESYDNGNKGEMYTFNQNETQTLESVTDYRYIGENPNNYIYFNCDDENENSTCEIWRIIGVFTVKDEKGNTHERLKIVKNESIGNYEWDSVESYYNYWKTSTLNTILNYGDFDYSLNQTSKSMIRNSEWYLGTIKGGSTNEIYELERSKISIESRNIYAATMQSYDYYYSNGKMDEYLDLMRKFDSYSYGSWNGKVALLYASDYFYTYSKGVDDVCYSTPAKCSGDNGANVNSSWLSWHYQWLLNRYVYEGYVGFYKNYFYDKAYKVVGSLQAVSVKNENPVYPTVYLSNDVYIKTGDGSRQHPYKLFLSDDDTDTEIENEIIESDQPVASDYLISKANGEEVTSYQDGNKGQMYTFHHEDGSIDYRYIGSKSYDYVSFDGYSDLWAIIGVFNVEDENGKVENRIKIVKTTYEDELTYDNEWKNSSVKNYLNDAIYIHNVLPENFYELVGDTKWYLGKINKDKNAEELYSLERNGSDYWIGKVALMYPTDFIYKYSSGIDDEAISNPWNYRNGCNRSEWFLSPLSDNSISLINLPSDVSYGYLSSCSNCSNRFRATAYLRSNVYIVDGNGTYSNPYRIALEPNPDFEEILVEDEESIDNNNNNNNNNNSDSDNHNTDNNDKENVKKYKIEEVKETKSKNTDSEPKYKKINIGDKVTYGDELYYAVSDSDEYTNYVTLLKANPLTPAELTRYAEGFNYDSKNSNYGLLSYVYNKTCNNDSNNSGCTNDFTKSDIKKVLDNWASDIDNDLVSVDGYKVRLLKYYVLDLDSSTSGTANEIEDIPDWLYNNYYSYWLMNTVDDSCTMIATFNKDGSTSATNVYEKSAVRPVINLKKCVLDNSCSNEKNDIKTDDNKEDNIKTEYNENNTRLDSKEEQKNVLVEVKNTLKDISYFVIIFGLILIIGGYILYKRIKKINN